MYPIAIPSRGRAGDVLTLNSIPEKFWKNVYLFVPKEEHEAYLRWHREFVRVGGNIVVVSDYNHKISEKRHLMVHHLNANLGADYFWMMDDDLKFFSRGGEYDTKLTMLEPSDYADMFNTVEEMANSEDRFCAIGISMRQGNNNLEWPGAWNTRLIRCGLYHTESFLKAHHNRLRFMGDFDVMIQMLKMGRDNYVTAMWAQDHRATNAKGGCETSRDEDAMEESANWLAQLHPDCVVTKKKVNKTGKLAERTDVTIYWKKARKSAA
jgi:hypothetical protein